MTIRVSPMLAHHTPGRPCLIGQAHGVNGRPQWSDTRDMPLVRVGRGSRLVRSHGGHARDEDFGRWRPSRWRRRRRGRRRNASGAGAGTAGPDAAAIGDEVGENLAGRRVAEKLPTMKCSVASSALLAPWGSLVVIVGDARVLAAAEKHHATPQAYAASSTSTPIGSQRMRRRMSSGAFANSRSIAFRSCWKCFQPS